MYANHCQWDAAARSKTTMPRLLAANRETATNSTGPEATAGKSPSSPKTRFDHLEDKDGFDAHRASTIAYYKPQGFVENFCVDHIAHCQWRLKRLDRWESAILNSAIVEALEGITEEAPEHDRIISGVVAKLCGKDLHLKTFRRYRSQTKLFIQLALASLTKIRNNPNC
jgi:hypothetical protein